MISSGLPPGASELLRQWLGEDWRATPLSGDASVRAYYRIISGDAQRLVLAWYPEEVRSQVRRFVKAYEAVAPYAPLPTVVGYAESAVLQRDVGDRTLVDVLQTNRQAGVELYRAAVDLLIGFQEAKADVNPPFTAAFFRNELAMAQEYFIEKLMGAPGGSGLERQLHALADKVAQHPYVLCHRDFHGENVHIIDDALFIIDYQDLRDGPDTYDLASLLRDRGVVDLLTEPVEEELLAHYAERIGGGADLRRRYFETLLQRSIKILGTFAMQPIVRGRMHYLDFIPATLRSVARCTAELPEFASLGEFFTTEFSLDRARQRAGELNTEASQADGRT